MHRRHLIPISLAIAGILTLTTVATLATQVNAAASTGPAVTTKANQQLTSPTGSSLRRAVRGRVEHGLRADEVASLRRIAKVEFADKLAVLAAATKAVQGPMWSCIRDAESGDNYGDTSGAYGILISSWDAFARVWSPFGSWAVPGEAPPAVQDLVAYTLYRVGGGFGGWHDRCTGT